MYVSPRVFKDVGFNTEGSTKHFYGIFDMGSSKHVLCNVFGLVLEQSGCYPEEEMQTNMN